MSIREIINPNSEESKSKRMEKQQAYWKKVAVEKITLAYSKNNEVVVVYDGTVIWRVTDKTDVKQGTLAFVDLDQEIERLRENFVLAHKGEEVRI